MHHPDLVDHPGAVGHRHVVAHHGGGAQVLAHHQVGAQAQLVADHVGAETIRTTSAWVAAVSWHARWDCTSSVPPIASTSATAAAAAVTGHDASHDDRGCGDAAGQPVRGSRRRSAGRVRHRSQRAGVWPRPGRRLRPAGEVGGAGDPGAHGVAHLGRRRHRFGDRHRGGGLPQRGDLAAAVRAAGQARLEGGPLLVVQRVQDVGTGQGVQVHRPLPSLTSRASRNRIRPSLIRVLAVPSGTASTVETSWWVYPRQ